MATRGLREGEQEVEEAVGAGGRDEMASFISSSSFYLFFFSLFSDLPLFAVDLAAEFLDAVRHLAHITGVLPISTVWTLSDHASISGVVIGSEGATLGQALGKERFKVDG